MSLKASFGALKEANGSWLGFGILILIWICSLVFDTTMIWILALYLDVGGAKNIHVLWTPIWGFKGCWRFMNQVWHLDLNLDMFTGLWYNHGVSFGSLSWLWRCEEHSYPLSPHFGLWRILEFSDWDLAYWSWLGYFHWSLIQPWSEFWLFILVLKVQRTSMSLKSSFGALEDAGGFWLGFFIFILI